MQTSLSIGRIRRRLGQLRAQIRGFVLLEAFFVVLAWLICLFWVELGLDYLPVQFGYSELPPVVRGVLLGVVLVGSIALLIRFGIHRLKTPLRDKSLALLLENRYPEFGDSLVTSIEVSDSATTNPTLLESTVHKADATMGQVRLGSVLNFSRLFQFAGVASLLVASVGVFSVLSPAGFRLATERIYLLGSEKWPRRCHLEMVGFKVKRENLIEGIPELDQTVESTDGVFKIAKGSSLRLLVRAAIQSADSLDGEGHSNVDLPAKCTLRYWSDSASGVRELQPIGAPSKDSQLYSLDGQPFEGVLGNVSFDIRGDDHRIGPFRVEVVDEPAAISTDLDCVFPRYMADGFSRWSPRKVRWTGRAELPEGTRVTVSSVSNKPLARVYASLTGGPMAQAEVTPSGFEFPLTPLREQVEVEFYFVDKDGVVSEQPLSLKIESLEDRAPDVTTRLRGIGTAITPDAVVPIQGEIKDDYGVARQWVEIEPSVSGQKTDMEISIETNGQLNAKVDFREFRQEDEGAIELKPGLESRVTLVVQAEDRYDLKGPPNRGVGVRYELDIVTPSQLLRLLEQQEVNQRRRLEQIYEEISDAREYLVRSKSERPLERQVDEPEDEPDDATDSPEDPIRKQEMRLLFCQRARLQIDKAAGEVQTVMEVFEEIREQLVNNRVDAEDRKRRLAERIIQPLRQTVTETFARVQDSIDRLEILLKSLQTSISDVALSRASDENADKAIVEVETLLREVDTILGVLVKYETQNELLEIVRQLLKNQKAIHERTERLRKQKAFEGLLD